MKFGLPVRRLMVPLLAAAGLAVVPSVTVTEVAQAAPVIHDGSSAARAAASCWEVKQTVPTSTSGVYWLQTPTLIAPQQFYCDQTTDGGGWVLIGRGREGWQWTYNGQGFAPNVRNTPDGTAAFAPATVSAQTVDGLLDGTRVDALPDGIRVRRATNATGTTYQEMRLRTTARNKWTWAIGGGIRTTGVTVDGVNYNGSASTQSWASGSNQSLLRLTITALAAHNYKQGFSYGTQIAGANNDTSYLWQYTTEKQAIPFAQVYLRPKLLSPAYPEIPDAGTAATTVRPLLSNKTSPATPWGVTGLAAGAAGEVVEVEDIAFIGRTAYVAGKFRYVQKGADGPKTEQSYLAAFDVDTGEWKPDFRPVLNATAWALAATPDGSKLIVGGEFTSVNGAPDTSSLAAVDPVTGATVTNWHAPLAYVGNDTPNVRSLDVQGNWIYAAGRFNRAAGGATTGAQITLRSLTRVSVTTGAPDPTWKPHVDGTVFEVDASARGDRVYFDGNFGNVNFTASPMVGIVSAVDGTNITGLNPPVSASGSGVNVYQQTILEVGDNVWQGGSQHILSKYGRDTYNVQRSNITRNGGDFQALNYKDGVIYGACHCLNYAYSGTNSYSSPITAASDVNSIRFIGAWDEQTAEFIPEFYVSSTSARNDMGPWALRNGPDGCMWFGGDFTGGSFVGSAQQWLGGFGKLCPRDTTAPSVPTNLNSTLNGTGVNLTWGASTDTEGSVTYEVLRDDRVIATTTSRSYSDADAPLPAKYWVRAVDDGGNRSASTASRTVLTPDVTAPTVTITGPASGGDVYGDVNLTADATDDRAVASVAFRVDGTLVGTDTEAPYGVTWSATAEGAHVVTAVATDTSGNATTSAPLTLTVPADTTAPSAVTDLAVTAAGPDSVSLAWSAATDDRKVTGYRIVRDGTALAPVTGTTATDSPLTPSTSYSYSVRAVDAAGNQGPEATVTVTTAVDPAIVHSETWPGAAGAAWSAPWTTSAVNGSATTTAGGRGALSYTDVSGAYARALLGTPAQANGELLTSFRWNETTANSFLNVYLRGSGGWQNSYRPRNGYGVQLSPGSGTVTVVKNVNGVTSTIRTVTGAQTVGTAPQWLRLRVSGSTIQFRIWKDGQAEPSTWNSTDTDSDVTAAGQAFISLNRASSNVGNKTVDFDNLTLRDISSQR